LIDGILFSELKREEKEADVSRFPGLQKKSLIISNHEVIA
jgi:hypothetical protein